MTMNGARWDIDQIQHSHTLSLCQLLNHRQEGFPHGPPCTIPVLKSSISSIMHQPIHREPTSIVQKVKVVVVPVAKLTTCFHKRHFPIHLVLDFNLLYPDLFVLRIVCLLELCVPSISPPPEFSQIPRFNISAFSDGSSIRGATDPTPETPKAKGTTNESDIRHHSLDDIPHPRRSWCCYGFCYIGLRRCRLVQVS